jgi:type II secretory pathway pseudopilin PulG
MLAVLAIIGLFTGIALPQLTAYKRRSAVVAAAGGLRSIFREVRSLAIAKSRNCAVKFTNAGSTWMYSFYEDGDGDGVLSDDIKAGIDHRLAGPMPLDLQLAPATIAVPPMKVRDPDGAWMLPTDSPVQFNRSAMCSFSPIGSGTPGSIYLSDGNSTFYAVRVLGDSGRVRLLRYNPVSGKWVEP